MARGRCVVTLGGRCGGGGGAVDGADVPAIRLSRGAPAGAAARAALRLGRKALLGVELLVRGRVDEVDAAVATGDRSIDVGHASGLPFPSSSAPSDTPRKDRMRGGAMAGGRAPRDPGARE